VAYSLANAYTGVSIGSATGVVTVASAAAAGTVTVQAACGSLTATATLTLAVQTSSLTLQTTANEIYHVAIKGSQIASFTGITYTITYDPAKLSLLDFAAQTQTLKTTAGVVTGTGLTILSHQNGILTFTAQKTIPSTYKWSGVLTVVKFQALSTGSTILTVS
jgi:hypothetical protein